MLKKIISGCQNGADQAGLDVGLLFGLETGGHTTRNCRRLDGYKPQLIKKYNLIEMDTYKYPPRTEQNVINSDGTARFFFNKNSLGEKLTFKYITHYNKPYIDINIDKITFNWDNVDLFMRFLNKNNIQILNVAGNSETNYPGTYMATFLFLQTVCQNLGMDRKEL